MGRSWAVAALLALALAAVARALPLSAVPIVEEDAWPAKAPGAQARSVRVVHTTDIHGWVSPNRHEPRYDADFGDFVSLAQHLKANAAKDGSLLLLCDTGDLVEGTGLSDSTNLTGEYIFPVIQMAQQYDALTIGNHDIGNEQTVDYIKNVFAPAWKGRYLTTNTIYKPDGSLVGAPYRLATYDNGLRVLFMGYLYNFTHENAKAKVVTVSESLLQPYFKEAMDAGASADLIVVLMHINPEEEPEMQQIYAAIRKQHPHKPLVLLTGHRHLKVFKQLDANAFAVESGSYFHTIGLIDFTLAPGPNGVQVQNIKYNWVDTNMTTFYQLAGTAKGSFLTPEGQETKRLIGDSFAKLHLNDPMGCSTDHYVRFSNRRNQKEVDIYRWWVDEVMPKVVVDASRPRPQFVITNKSSLRADIYSGWISRDDLFSVMPFKNSFMSFDGVTGDQIVSLLRLIRERTGRPVATSSYKLDRQQMYDVVLASYDAISWTPHMQEIVPGIAAAPYSTNLDSAQALAKFVGDAMPCSSSCPCPQPSAPVLAVI